MTPEFSIIAKSIQPSLLGEVRHLCEVIFEKPVPDLEWRACRMPGLSIACARLQQQLVGFKIGYAHGQFKYYSWLGGVHPDHRGNGIALALARAQHTWAGEHGFTTLETATGQDNAAMIKANLKFGFKVCGLKHGPRRVQVLFSKTLKEPGAAI